MSMAVAWRRILRIASNNGAILDAQLATQQHNVPAYDAVTAVCASRVSASNNGVALMLP